MLEIFVHTQWEVGRYQIYYDMNTNPAVKDKPKRVTDVVQFPWETEMKRFVKEQTVEEQKTALMNLFVTFGKGKRG